MSCMEERLQTTCDKCKDLGLLFRSKHGISPVDFIEGNAEADIWIIGLNPKGEIGKIEERSLNKLKKFNPNCHPYFKDFKKVSERLYKNWEGSDSNIAHTDLVKCFSDSFPPKVKNSGMKKQRDIVDNCVEYLMKQILINKPKLIICNGSRVCWEMIRIFPPKQANDRDSITSYYTNMDNHKFWIVLSGFIGRIDNRNKRRLGMEIEQIIEKEKISI